MDRESEAQEDLPSNWGVESRTMYFWTSSQGVAEQTGPWTGTWNHTGVWLQPQNEIGLTSKAGKHGLSSSGADADCTLQKELNKSSGNQDGGSILDFWAWGWC